MKKTKTKERTKIQKYKRKAGEATPTSVMKNAKRG